MAAAEEADTTRDDLDVAAALALIVFPRMTAEIALDGDAPPLGQVLRAELPLPVPG